MGQKMSDAPVYFALAQVRFNAILALDQYLPAIQDTLRKAGYPDFERSFLGVLNITAGMPPSPSQPIPAMQPQPRYTFLNEARTSGFVLEQTMVLFHTTAYDRFETFSGEFFKGVAAVHEAATLDYSERVGLRFLDAVCPKEGESLDQYLVPSVLGIYDKLVPRELLYSFSESRTKQGNTMLVSRAIIFPPATHDGSVAFPPELQPVSVRLAEKFTHVRGSHAVIDTDSWLEEREKFGRDSLEKRLNVLHAELRRSFDLMVTPHALKVWS